MQTYLEGGHKWAFFALIPYCGPHFYPGFSHSFSFWLTWFVYNNTHPPDSFHNTPSSKSRPDSSSDNHIALVNGQLRSSRLICSQGDMTRRPLGGFQNVSHSNREMSSLFLFLPFWDGGYWILLPSLIWAWGQSHHQGNVKRKLKRLLVLDGTLSCYWLMLKQSLVLKETLVVLAMYCLMFGLILFRLPDMCAKSSEGNPRYTYCLTVHCEHSLPSSSVQIFQEK